MNNKRHTQTIIIIALLLLAILTGLIWWLKPKSASIPVNDADTSSTTLSTSLTNTTDTANANNQITNSDNLSRFTTGLERMPSSLQGTDVDGGIIVDESRQLVVTEGLRRLFDYFLSAMGEEDEATIIARVDAYIRSHTPEPAASSAIQIFRQYVSYLKGLDDLQANYGSLQMQATQAGKLEIIFLAYRKP